MKSGAPGEGNVKSNERPVVVSKTFRYSLEDEFDKKMSFDTWFQEEVICITFGSIFRFFIVRNKP